MFKISVFYTQYLIIYTTLAELLELNTLVISDAGLTNSDENGRLVGETKCENVPRRFCMPNNCGMVEAEKEQCHLKQTLVVQEIPQEVTIYKKILRTSKGSNYYKFEN